MNFKKMSAKALSVFMSLIMLFSIVVPAVSAGSYDHEHATDKIDINYVSLGDSMTNGFGLSGYECDRHADGSEHTANCDENCGGAVPSKAVNFNGFLQEPSVAYPSRFAAYLAGVNQNDVKNDQNVFVGAYGKVTLHQLAMSSMRVEELSWILNVDLENFNASDWNGTLDNPALEEEIAKWYETYPEFGDYYTCYKAITGIWRGLCDDEGNALSVKEVIEYYQNAIKGADLITVGTGNSNFGAYMLERIMRLVGVEQAPATDYDAFINVEANLNKLPVEFKEKILEYREKLIAMLPEEFESLGSELISQIADIMINTVVSFCLNYKSAVDAIVRLNPNADIVIVGLMNTLNGVKIEVAGQEKPVDLGAYMDELLNLGDAYITTYIACEQVKESSEFANHNVYYVPTPDVDVIINTYATDFNDIVRKRFYESIVGANGNGMIWGLAGLSSFPYQWIEAFEQDEVAFSQTYGAGATKMIQIYLAIEKAVVDASKKPSITLESIISLAGLRSEESTIVGDMMGALKKGYDYTDAIANSIKNEDEAYEKLLAQLNPILVNKDKNYSPLKWLKGLSINHILFRFAYIDGDMGDFFADVAANGKDAVIEKIADAIYNTYYTVTLSDEELVKVNKYQTRATEDAEALVNTILGVKDQYYSKVAVLYFFPAAVSAEMNANENLSGLLNLFGRCVIGNGLGTHPSATGHEDLFNAIREKYVEEHTVIDETVNNIVTVRDYIFKNYDKFYEEAYKLAVKEGYIAQMDAYLVEAINAVRYAEEWANGYSDYFRSEDFAIEITAVADNTVATIEALRAVIANADKLDADLNNSIVALAAQIKANLEELAALINVAIADAYAYGAPIVDAEIAKALAIINAKVNAVLEAIAYIEAKVQEQIAIAEAMIANYIEVAKAYLAELFGEAVETAEELAAKLEEAKAYLDALIKAFLSNSAYSANYTVTADSYYLAIGGDDAVYAELLAAKMGLGEDQFSATTWDDINATTLAKADLITIGYTESMISGFATEQIIAYVVEYINVTLRESVNEYVEEALTYFFANMTPTPSAEMVDMIIAYFHEYVNATIDGVVDGSGFGEAVIADMDWAELVGEESASYIEGALQTVTDSLAKVGLCETFAKEIPVADFVIAQLGAFDPSIAAMLSYFDVEEIKAMFGEYATYTLEIPVADAVAFAVESYIYSYAKFNVEYAQLVYAVNAINPDAQIVLLGNYSAFAGLGFDFVVDEITIDLGEIFTSEVKDSANSYVNEVFGAIIGALEHAADDETIDSVLGSVDSAITSGASTLYEIIFGILADVEDVRDYINGTEVALPEFSAPEISIPEISIPSCPALESLVDVLGKINFNALADVDWVKLIGIDLNGIVADITNGTIETVDATTIALIEVIFEIQNAIAEVENTLVDLGIFETYTITLPTLDIIYDNLDKFDAETRALLESIDQEALRAMIGEELANFVVEVKTLSSDVVATINGIYDMIADTKITVFEGATIDLGELISAPTSIHSLFYAYTMKNVIFVDISEAGIASEATSFVEFILEYLTDNSVADVTEAGHAYIAEQIYAALNVKCGHRINGHVCDYCGEVFSTCVDETNDHKCDICGEVLSEHVYDNACDADCNLCGETRTVAGHVYDNACDASCNVCGATRTPAAHVYDNACDASCNVCGATRTVGEHVYDNACDASCNTCGATRTPAEHAYDNACDASCNVCGATRTPAEHVYDNACDADCNVCGATRTPAEHVYDNACDTDCNVCGATRTTEHAYDNACDADCNVCGATRTPAAHVFGEWVTTKEATKKEAGERQHTCSVCGAVETEVIAQLKGLSTGAVVAIVAGSVVVAAGIGVGIFFGIKTGFFAKLFKKK